MKGMTVMGMISRITSFFRAPSVSSQLSGQQSHLDKLERDLKKNMSRIERRASEVSAVERRMDEDLESARRTCRRFESALEEVREKNRVLEQTIDALVASHRLLIARYDAEAAVATRMRSGSSAGN